MRISRLLILATALFLMVSCQNKAQKEQIEPEIHELLTVTSQDYTLDAEYPASIQGAQDIKIIPRVEGHLMGVYVKEGERVREGQLLFRLDDAPSRAAVESANANVQLPDGTLYEHTGRVESISGVVDERTGAVSVCARFDNPDGMLLSGGTGKIVIPTELHNAIVIPQEATYSIQDKVYVMKVVDGKAISTIIQVAPQNNGKEYVVISGLAEGDVIIAKGAGFVEEGTVIVKP